MTRDLRYFGKLTVNALHRILARGCCLLCGGEKPDVMHLPMQIHSGAPHLSLRIKTDPYESGCVVSLSRFIASVFGIRGKPQIRDSIVRSLSVDVVDLMERPIPAPMTPHNLMSVIIERIGIRNLDLDVSLHARSGDGASISAVPFARFGSLILPSQKSSFSLVVKKQTNKFSTQRWSAFCRHLRTSCERLLDRRAYVNLTPQLLEIGG